MIKEDILGVPSDTPWGEALSENLWVFPVLLIVGVVLTLIVRRIWKRLPDPDWKTSFDVDTNLEPIPPELLKARSRARRQARAHREGDLVGLVTIIFAQMLPDIDVSIIAIIAGVAFVSPVNAFVSHWFATRGTQWRSLATEFAAMAFCQSGCGAHLSLAAAE